MSKRNIAYIKPEEPNFLKRLKAEAGYKEGDTVETKRQSLPEDADDLQDTEEEKPVVVVLEPGDLTAEEVDKIQKQEEQAPANLEDRIVFRAPTKTSSAGSKQERAKEERSAKRNKVSGVKNTKLLSFDQEEDDDE